MDTLGKIIQKYQLITFLGEYINILAEIDMT